jgi:hypothetical protein
MRTVMILDDEGELLSALLAGQPPLARQPQRLLLRVPALRRLG